MIASGVAGWLGALFTHHSEVLRRVFSALANISSGVTGSARGGCISSWKASAQEEEEPSSTQGEEGFIPSKSDIPKSDSDIHTACRRCIVSTVFSK